MSFVLRLTITQLVILLVLCISDISIGNADELDQATLKALYTYKFGKFTEWPDKKLNAATGQFQYCILGQNPFSQSTLKLIIGKSVQSVPLTVEVFDSGLVPEEVLSACHILFVSQSEKYRLSTILTSLKRASVLTISDIPEFSGQGGMITLTENRGKLRFQINPKALQQADIFISSKIMELAEIVDHGS